MDEYIKKEALMVALCKEITGDGDYYNGKDDMQDEIRDMVSWFPAADVAPVRHGKWLPTTKWWQGGSGWKRCSECGILHLGKSNFCPKCGAKMDLED